MGSATVYIIKICKKMTETETGGSLWLESWTRARIFVAAASRSGRLEPEVSTTARQKNPMRILLLHGLGQDAATFREATSGIRSCADALSVEFSLCQASHSATNLASIFSNTSSSSGGMQWYNMSPSSLGAGWAFSMEQLVEILESEGPFDGVLGFSQGAAALSMLVAEQILLDKKWFRFACFVGGFLPNAEHMRERINRASLNGKFLLPSWHSFGLKDFVIPSEKSQLLASYFEAPSVVSHQGGHVVPLCGDAAIKEHFQSFLRLQER